jgi:hypothetical protein
MLHARHSSTQVRSVITITGLGDHDQPDWLITMTGIRIQSEPFVLRKPFSVASLISTTEEAMHIAM